jgi:ATP phosphoribosyltransferase
VASLKAPWGARARKAARAILMRIAAEEEGRNLREVRACIATVDQAFADTLQARHEARLPFGMQVPGGIVTIHCPHKAVFDLVADLTDAGATDVTVRSLDYVFRQDNPLLEKLLKRI